MFNPLVDELNWHCVHQRWNSRPNPMCSHSHSQPNACKSTFSIVHNSRTCCLRSNSSQKIISYNWHPTNAFFFLVIEIFGCLHKQANVFLEDCANAISNLKESKSHPLFVLITFLGKKISIMLRRIQASSILNLVVARSLTTSWLPPPSSTTP